MKLLSLKLAAILVISQLSLSSAQAYEEKQGCKESDQTRFIFSWPISDDCSKKPRGGSSKGADISLATQLRKPWLALQQAGLSKQERDRRAILAMQGGYKVNFDFLETVGFSEGYQSDRPYQSWGTEYVYVVKDTPNFISLQHIMVMFFKQDDGSVSEPMVMKHWRQDWRFEDTSLLEYSHDNNWKKRLLSKNIVEGTWSQAVFQVDDSPRYESFGNWKHNGSFSTWVSQTTRRPLPRREYSVRDDYHALEGFNRHTVTRHGWVQEEENWKLVLDDNGEPFSQDPYLAKEEGLARYQAVKDFDFSGGDTYFSNTEPFWNLVRSTWSELISKSQEIKLKGKHDGQPMFMPLFSLASEFADKKISIEDAQKRVDDVLANYLIKK